MSLSRSLLACSVAAFALGAAACGKDEEQAAGPGREERTATSQTTTAPHARPVATLKVKETEFEIDPQNPEITQAGVVRFEVENAGQAPHALEIHGPKGEAETETIEPGSKATLEADLSRPGTYKWYCPVGDHEQRGMTGEVTVAGGARGSKMQGGQGGY